jgi:hypothetical protein
VVQLSVRFFKKDCQFLVLSVLCCRGKVTFAVLKIVETMNCIAKNFLPVVFLFLGIAAQSQRLSKTDRITLKHLKEHTAYLADDKLEGRRTGTKGEQLAADYISQQFAKAGLSPKGTTTGSWLQPFEVNEGKEIAAAALLIMDGEHLTAGSDFFPFPWSVNQSVESIASPSIAESGSAWFYDLSPVLKENANNPHFDLMEAIRTKEKQAAQKGATALLVFSSDKEEKIIKYDGKDRSEQSTIPVLFIQGAAVQKIKKDPSHTWDLKLRAAQQTKVRTGHNVIGYVDNGAALTIILGAHFDHLGYGEDNNSRNTGEPAIHNGADDNASGSAVLMELARVLKSNGTKGFNYLFIAFSGEELGLFGSKYFTDHPTIPLSTVSYMINMDMVGRLNDSSKSITIGGVGTSPAWGNLLNGDKKPSFQIKVDSSGTGPSDHTSFYRKDIPVLFFFTGLHTDYHKPSDDFDKINTYGQMEVLNFITRVISRSESLGKLAFQKTREQQMSTSARFSVSMGIMPDYTFGGTGVKVDGVSDGKAAQKAGVLAGDVVIQLGEYAINSLENYMQALSKFKKGETTKVKVKRGEQEEEFTIVF